MQPRETFSPYSRTDSNPSVTIAPSTFNPLSLEKIRLRTDQGELTLARATPNSPWRIVKPLDLTTDPAAVKSLLEGLVTLGSHLTQRSL